MASWPAGKESLYYLLPKQGYTLVTDVADYLRKAQKADKVVLFPEQEACLKRVYEETLLNPSDTLVLSLYEANEPMTETAKQIINEIACIAWACGSHTAGYVSLYAIGVGVKKFGGTIDNTDIPRIVSYIFEYK